MNKAILIIIIVIGLVLVGGYFFLRGGYQAPTPEIPGEEITTEEEITSEEEISISTQPVKEITVSGTEFRFNPSEITVSAGERVRIIFKNEGRVIHDFVIENLGIRTKVIREGQTDTIEFEAPQPGTYIFYCSVSGHREAGMEGRLIVE